MGGLEASAITFRMLGPVGALSGALLAVLIKVAEGGRS